jgi:hypothetical protein
MVVPLPFLSLESRMVSRHFPSGKVLERAVPERRGIVHDPPSAGVHFAKNRL